MDCPFCARHINEITFHESENFRAIYNIAPILPGHSLIVPKTHCSSLFNFTDAELSELMIFSRAVIVMLQKAFSCVGFNLTLQEQEEAGQTIEHFHLHIIPRQPNDLPSPGDWYPELQKTSSKQIDSADRPKLTRKQMVSIVEKIRLINT